MGGSEFFFVVVGRYGAFLWKNWMVVDCNWLL